MDEDEETTLKWEKFFKQYKDCIIYGHEDMVHFTVEEFYQAIKDRMYDDAR